MAQAKSTNPDADFVKDGVTYAFFTNTERERMTLEILKRLQKSQNFQIVIREEAYDTKGRRLSRNIVATFVARDQHYRLWGILDLFKNACLAAEKAGVNPKYF